MKWTVVFCSSDDNVIHKQEFIGFGDAVRLYNKYRSSFKLTESPDRHFGLKATNDDFYCLCYNNHDPQNIH